MSQLRFFVGLRASAPACLATLLSLLSIDPSMALAQSFESEEAALFGEADEEAARLAFKQGRAAFEQGLFGEALERFEHAYALSGRSELLFNIGLAADRIREDERALEAFEQYLEETPQSEHREQVQMRVIALRRALARRKESQPSGATVPAPAEVARASMRDERRAPLEPEPRREVDDGGSVLESFWFWAGVTVVLVGGGVTAYVLLQPEERAELPAPNTDVTVQTLRLAP